MKINEYEDPLDELTKPNSKYFKWRIKGKLNDAKRDELYDAFKRYINTNEVKQLDDVGFVRETVSRHTKSFIKKNSYLSKKQRKIMMMLSDYKLHKKPEIINRVGTTKKGLKSLVRETRKKILRMGLTIKGKYKSPGGYQLFKKHTSSA